MSRTVQRPQFTWWPYRTLAIAVPVLAAGACYFAYEMSEERTEAAKILGAMTVFFAVMGAGNAYLFAIAIGDFGKSVLAVPVGAMAGFAAAQLFAYPVANGVYALVLLGLAVYALAAGAFTFRIGCGALILLSFTALAMLMGRSPRYEPLYSLICGYPFVCGVVAASMPYERSVSGRFSAWLTGSLSACYGLVIAIGLTLFLVVVVELSASPGGSLSRSDRWLLDSFMRAFVFGVANYFCAMNLFYSVYRVNEPSTMVPPTAIGATETNSEVVISETGSSGESKETREESERDGT